MEALTEKYPGWTITESLGAYTAVPRGAVVLSSLTISGLGQKLAEHEAQAVGDETAL
jgi:hypothetical protein